MTALTLIRDYAGPACTLGRLIMGDLVLQTLERPWIPYPPQLCGHPDTSCVPAGVYQLALHDTPKFPRHFALVNEALGIYHEILPRGVVGRTSCLIHAANYVTQLEGCCAVGREREFVLETSRGIWSEAADVSRDDELRPLCERAGLDWADCAAALDDEALAARVKANTEALEGLGHWGVPLFAFEGELFWGQDRIGDVATALRGAGLER